MENLFTKHPHHVGESYFKHLRFALTFGGYMTIGGLACIIHAIFPFLFEQTGSHILFKMMHDFIERMQQADERILALQQSIHQKIKN